MVDINAGSVIIYLSTKKPAVDANPRRAKHNQTFPLIAS
jgi:hypothetical protein